MFFLFKIWFSILEIVCRLIPYREFESLSLRHTQEKQGSSPAFFVVKIRKEREKTEEHWLSRSVSTRSGEKEKLVVNLL